MRKIRLTFVEDDVSAVAELDEEHAPKTVRAIWDQLSSPVRGEAAHAICSGSELMVRFPEEFQVEPENYTTRVLPGELGFRFVDGKMLGYPDHFSEILIFYDRDALPANVMGPSPVNVFGRISENFAPFQAVCLRIRREGVKELVIERLLAAG